MKSIVKTLALSCLVALLPIASNAQKSKVQTDTISSQILNCKRAYNIYLPHDYEVDKDKSYPVVYLLHGLTDINDKWTTRGHIREVMNNLVRSGEVDEMIIVMPNAGVCKGETDTYHGYFNLSNWAYEDFFFNELLPHVEQKYRIKGDKQHRAIAGLSMGGGGTVSYAQRHPDMFCAAYAMSALMGMNGVDKLNRSDFPDPKALIMMDSALEHDCVKYVTDASKKTLEELRSVKWFVDCGDDDFLLEGNLNFILAMRAQKVPFEFRVREGAHNWEYWNSAMYICLPFFNRCFED